MNPSSDDAHASAPVNSLERPAHRAARLEDWFHDVRERRARRRGHQPTVVPYAGYGSTEWVRMFCRILLTRPRSDSRGRKAEAAISESSGLEKPSASIRGWRSFTSVPVRSAAVTIRIGDQSVDVISDRGGVVDTVIPVSLAPGDHTATLTTPGGAPVQARVTIVSPDVTFGVISDIDDTVMVTALPRPLLAAWNTFVLDEHARIPTPGMAVLIDRIMRAHAGAPLIYLSTGAWNVAPTLNRFLSRNLYPRGPLLLTDWGPTHDRLFRSGRAHKEENLRRLAAEFPTIRWLLIGDDGQHDEDIYGEFAAEFPQNVAAVAIRELSPSEAVLAGGRSKSLAPGTSVPWIMAPDGSGIAEHLVDVGVL